MQGGGADMSNDISYMQAQQQSLQQQQAALAEQQRLLEQQRLIEQQRLLEQQNMLEQQRLLEQQQQYQMRSMTLDYAGYSQQELLNQQQQRMQSFGGAGAAPNLMSAEEIRVDCAQLTNNGRYVVTGSIYGPPQVWDMKSGELVKVMMGEDLSSTDLHLANGDTLLVGQVAELEQVEADDVAAAQRLHHRKLQVWDFDTGRPLEMRKNELCTASAMMNDGERMVLGRTEKFGGGTTIIIWDVLGNEPIRHIKCEASVGFADHISFLALSKDNRFVCAGFQNSFDGKANYIVFDLSSSDQVPVAPKTISFDAVVDVTKMLDNHEAITGTRSGELIIWSMRTGKTLRQLVSAPPSGSGGTLGRRGVYSEPAHQGEVKDLAVSKDGLMLVSASADGTLKIWDLEMEKQTNTFVGHKDEVWCCTISNDNELIASGSRDRSIRLWRTQDGSNVAAINAGVDVFKVLLSNNKKTIVALADRDASRKLIMLKVVRSKTRTLSRTGGSGYMSDGGVSPASTLGRNVSRV